VKRVTVKKVNIFADALVVCRWFVGGLSADASVGSDYLLLPIFVT